MRTAPTTAPVNLAAVAAGELADALREARIAGAALFESDGDARFENYAALTIALALAESGLGRLEGLVQR